MANFFSDVVENVKSKVSSSNFFSDVAEKFKIAMTPQEGVPHPSSPDVLGLIKDIAQGTARSGASVVLSLTSVPQIKPEEIREPGLRNAYEFLYGKEPIKSIGTRAEELSKSAQEIGVPEKIAKPLSLPIIVGLTALDFTPLGGEGDVLKVIAKSKLVKGISVILKKINVADEFIQPYAEKLAKISDPRQVKVALEDLDKMMRTTKNVAPGLRAVQVTPESKPFLEKLSASIEPELSAIKGAKLGHDEVIEAAKTSEMLTQVTTREAALTREAQLLRAKQQISALSKNKEVTPELIDALRVVSSEASALGRQLEALKIEATPELFTIREEILSKLANLGIETDKLLEAAKGVDFNNAKQVAELYRKFVPAKLSEIIDEYRYINLLSSPKTHIVNAFSNLLQGGVLAPTVKLVSGVTDAIYSGLTGANRTSYASEVPAYFKGMFNAVGDAFSNARATLRGERFTLRPDLSQIPSGAKVLAPFQVIPRLLESSDILFRTLIEGAEKEALALRYSKQGVAIDDALMQEISEIAKAKGEYYVFRKALDPSNKTGQGILLSYIDKLTAGIYSLRNVAGVKWFIPFIQTPMNILKQGIEFSPAGVLTIPGNTAKLEQFSKSVIGSMVFMGASYLAAKGDSTWAAPVDKKERDIFYAAGRQPYSFRFPGGDNWYSYSRLGVLAYPMAMAAAVKYYTEQNPKAVTEGELEKIKNIIVGITGFFADQSYLEGIGDFIDVGRGDPDAAARAASNLPQQLIPLSSLQRWVNDFVDPIFRKSNRDFSVEAVIDNLKKGIPGLSNGLPSYKTPYTREEERKQYPLVRALSPVGVTTSAKDYEELYNLLIQRRTQSAEVNKIKSDMRKLLDL